LGVDFQVKEEKRGTGYFFWNGRKSSLSPFITIPAFTPTINEWNGNKYLQLNLKACRPSG
jgi:hypothetical protein